MGTITDIIGFMHSLDLGRTVGGLARSIGYYDLDARNPKLQTPINNSGFEVYNPNQILKETQPTEEIDQKIDREELRQNPEYIRMVNLIDKINEKSAKRYKEFNEWETLVGRLTNQIEIVNDKAFDHMVEMVESPEALSTLLAVYDRTNKTTSFGDAYIERFTEPSRFDGLFELSELRQLRSSTIYKDAREDIQIIETLETREKNQAMYQLFFVTIPGLEKDPNQLYSYLLGIYDFADKTTKDASFLTARNRKLIYNV